MEEISEEVRSLLALHLRGASIELEDVYGIRLGGSIIWEGFNELSQSERQRRIWDIYRTHLPLEHQMRLATFLTFTPNEIADMEAVLVA